jgi:hypothetical protein
MAYAPKQGGTPGQRSYSSHGLGRTTLRISRRGLRFVRACSPLDWLDWIVDHCDLLLGGLDRARTSQFR